MSNDGKKLPFWKVKMEIEGFDIKMSSYDDVDFCFSWDNSTTKDSSSCNRMYRTKKLAELHLNLKL
eukprot:91504-Ditylum_brightwellii.AAC.1